MNTMFPMKTSYLLSIASLFILLFVIYGVYLKVRFLQLERDQALLRVSDLQQHIENQNQAIDSFNKEAASYKAQLIESRKQADQLLDESNKKYAILLKEKAPTQCEAAIKWGAQKAKDLIN